MSGTAAFQARLTFYKLDALHCAKGAFGVHIFSVLLVFADGI